MKQSIRWITFFYYKRVIGATYSFKSTVFLQNRNCSKEILTIIIQACIYWKNFVIWRHHFQPSIFSMIVSLFHGSTWSNPHVKETVYFTALVKTNPCTQSAISFFFDKLKYEIRKKSFDFRFYAEVETENIKIGGFPIFKITEHWNSNLKFVFRFSF